MSDLNLNPRIIINAINEYCKRQYGKVPNLSNSTIENKTTQINISLDNRTCVFRLFIKSNGKSSIQIQGKDIDFGNEIKEYVIQECQISDKYNYNVSLPYYDSFFDDFIKFLKEDCKAKEKVRKPIPTGEQYVYEADFFDKITLHKYNNGNLFIQGKPLWLSQQINYYLSNKDCYAEVIKAQEKEYNINLDMTDIEKILDSYFSTASTKLNLDIKKMIKVSLAFLQISITGLPDYSAFTSPALRCLESFLQEVFVKNGINYIPKEKLGDFFAQEFDKYVLQPKYIIGKITKTNKRYIEDIYNKYYEYRHALFHTSTPSNETFFIKTKEDADKLIIEVCNLIKDGYINVL